MCRIVMQKKQVLYVHTDMILKIRIVQVQYYSCKFILINLKYITSLLTISILFFLITL